MATFDPNQWYRVTTGIDVNPGLAMDGTSLYHAGRGSVLFKLTDTTDSEEQWQIFPVNDSTYILRTKASGPGGFLGASYSANETEPGNTRPRMANLTLSDKTMYWSFTSAGNGLFFMSNEQNGTGWRLHMKETGLMSISGNTTATQNEQGFMFKEIGPIDNGEFSSLNVSRLVMDSGFGLVC
ncbi:hypothetical protein BU16DRAFT_316254 [Lophium mytilinum]|uniref:Ricin B lectin domain-containing protein n=1 Tax=Lophium mytilinum TaxID=390894 RepID=A0A6A6QZ10_9PEZI|nr:hypothetical protein BU16DRAFT_316254 [Lophium mytilinum]